MLSLTPRNQETEVLTRISHILREKCTRRVSTRPGIGACSGFTFRRVEGLSWARCTSTAPKLLPQRIAAKAHISQAVFAC